MPKGVFVYGSCKISPSGDDLVAFQSKKMLLTIHKITMVKEYLVLMKLKIH